MADGIRHYKLDRVVFKVYEVTINIIPNLQYDWNCLDMRDWCNGSIRPFQGHGESSSLLSRSKINASWLGGSHLLKSGTKLHLTRYVNIDVMDSKRSPRNW